MIWYSRTFEKSLRRQVRREVRASPELKKECRRFRRSWKQTSAMVVVRPLMMVLAAFLVGAAFTGTGHIQTGLAVLSLWSFTVLLCRAQSFILCLYQDPDINSFVFLPVTELAIFERQLRRFWVRSLFALGDLLAAGITLGWLGHFVWWQWLVLAPGILAAWLTMLAAAVFGARRFPAFMGLMTFLPWVLWIGVIVFKNVFALNVLLTWLDHQADWLNVLLPTGWVPAVLLALLEPGHWLNLGLVLPVAILWWWGRKTLAQLRADYAYQEISKELAADKPPEELPLDLEAMEQVAQTPEVIPRHFGVTTIAEIIQTRQFLLAPAWQERGWMERQLWRWFTVRERTLAELAFPSGIVLSTRWKTVFRNLLIAILAGFVVGSFIAVAKPWIMGLGIFLTFIWVLAFMQDSGSAFRPVFCSGVNIPLYAAYAVGFRELARMLFKFSVIQLPALLLWGTISGGVIAYMAGLSLSYGLFRGIPAAGVIFAGRFILIVFGFSGGTNDSAGFRLRTLFLFLMIVFFGRTFLILGTAGLLWPFPLAALGWTLGAMADAYLLFLIYGWFYHRNRFDLMNLPRR